MIIAKKPEQNNTDRQGNKITIQNLLKKKSNLK